MCVKFKVDGSWSEWSMPGVCSTTCGSGQKVKKRICNNPKPLFGGKDCVGDAEITVACFEEFCPGNLTLPVKIKNFN